MRIALLAIVPLVGVFAAGGAAWYGQRSAATAFEAYDGYAGLATDAARVRASVRDLRFSAVDFAERYTEAAPTNFARARMEAMMALGEARRKPEAAALQGEIEQSLKQLGEAASAFDLVRVTIETLGKDDTSGLTGRMNESVQTLEVQARRVAANFDDGAGILDRHHQVERDEGLVFHNQDLDALDTRGNVRTYADGRAQASSLSSEARSVISSPSGFQTLWMSPPSCPRALICASSAPKPLRDGGPEIVGPPRSIQVSTMCPSSIRQVIDTRPVACDSDPCFAALVATS